MTSDTAKTRSQADRLVDLATERFDLVVSTEGETYTVPVDGPRLAIGLRGSSKSLRAQLAAEYRRRYDKVPSSSALADALVAIEGLALDSTQTDVHLRRAFHEGDVWVDLGRPDGKAVHITKDGWEVVDTAPVLFRRTVLTGPMPYPLAGSDLSLLRDFWNVDDDAFDLLVGFLVSASIANHPVPAPVLLGEQGTGKTTITRMLVDLLDPSPADRRPPPRDMTDWSVVAAASSVVAVDNVSRLTDWLSDALCRAITGDTFPRRKLYSDGAIVVHKFRRTVILNGIDLGALRGDLLDRSVVVELPQISNAQRQPESDMWKLWRLSHSRLLGALFTATSQTLAELDDVYLPLKPRMADHAVVLAALDVATGLHTLRAYTNNTKQSQSMLADTNVVAAALRELMADRDDWSGRPSDLLETLTQRFDHPPKGWPTTPTVLSGELKRSAPALRLVGIGVDWTRTDKGRTITCTKQDTA